MSLRSALGRLVSTDAALDDMAAQFEATAESAADPNVRIAAGLKATKIRAVRRGSA